MVVGGLGWSQLKSGGGSDEVYLPGHAAQRSAHRAVAQQVYQTQGRIILARLRRAEEVALDEALTPVNEYFTRASRGTTRFSRAVLNREAQWSLVVAKAAALLASLDRLPTWLQWRWLNKKARLLAAVLDRRSFHKYVQGQLRRHVLSRAGLESVVRQAAQRYQHRLAANDTAFLNALEMPKGAARATAPTREGPRRYEAVYEATARDALHRSAAGAQSELLGNITQRVSSKLLVALAAYALKEGAVDLGLLSAGTASALWSFGVGLAVAALANVALRYFMNRGGQSPQKTIGQHLAAEVAAMRRCVVEGCTRRLDGDVVAITGLRAWLGRHRAQREHRRARILREALGAGES